MSTADLFCSTFGRLSKTVRSQPKYGLDGAQQDNLEIEGIAVLLVLLI
jgi:hypothetical protein